MLNVILIGPQGSGKGTQAQLIAKEFGLKHIEMGLLIRCRVQQHNNKSAIIDHLVNKKGMLLPDGIVLDMIYDELKEQPNKQGYLFDGFPRTVKQYQALKEFLKEKGLKLNVALYFNISDDEAMKRLGVRKICRLCKKVYSQQLEPERVTCDCGGALIKRADDESLTISSRLAAFHQHTKPILMMMKKDGVFREINGEQTIENIFIDIKKQLK